MKVRILSLVARRVCRVANSTSSRKILASGMEHRTSHYRIYQLYLWRIPEYAQSDAMHSLSYKAVSGIHWYVKAETELMILNHYSQWLYI